MVIFVYETHRTEVTSKGMTYLTRPFGTSTLSFGSRNWKCEDGDKICIEAVDFGAQLVNRIYRIEPVQTSTKVEPA